MCVCEGMRESQKDFERSILRWRKTGGESLTATCFQNEYKRIVSYCNF